MNNLVALSHTPSSLEDKSEDAVKLFLHSTGLSLPLCDNITPVAWFRYSLDFSGGRAGEELGVLTGVDDTELLFVSFGDDGNEWTCSKFDELLVQGWDKSCSRVGLSLGFIISIQEMRSLASIKQKQRAVNDESNFYYDIN